jgi:hypothetical protein
MSRILLSQCTLLPEDIIKTVIDEIYERHGEKTVYVGRGIPGKGLFKSKTLSYLVGGYSDELIIDYKLFSGNGGKSHYFVKQNIKIEITKIIV